ncbi:hypothetical protein WJX72_001871 [[Myrmecia] bisecta]|uniref:PI3K/PI4K catalytic domain-containing protein n=1 Tax=[Myrmecia] bisecta TaxID=41462 RepID=A0AAW1QEC0_9CHLO
MGRAKSAEPRYYTFVPVASGVGSPPAQQRNCCRSGSQRVGAQRVCSILLVLLLAVLVCLYKADLLLALHNPSKASDPLQQGAEGQITDSLLEAAESEAVAPAPPVPPAPSNVRDWQLAWPPGVTPEGVAEATRRLEALTQRTLHLDDPEQPWNQQPSRFELQSVDGHVRHNPSFKATANNQTMFVKFPCIRGHHDLDNTLMCERGQLQNATAASKRHTESIQRVSDYCGFGHIRTRSWTAPVHGTTPQGIEVNGQLGMFAEWARGTNPESMGKEAKRVWANSVPIEWVWYAAVHDFIMCESDRHQGNLVIPDDHPEQPFVFIDNDHELSNRRSLAADLLTPRDPSCIPSSLFFPMNLESWRVHHYHLPLMKLDYRCSTAPGQDIPLPSRIRACLQVFAATSAAELQRNFDIVLLEFAEGLRQRAQDLLELGFWGALEKTASQGEAGFWADPSRLPFEDTMFPHWRGSIWRPLEAPFCDWLEPIPAGR